MVGNEDTIRQLEVSICLLAKCSNMNSVYAYCKFMYSLMLVPSDDWVSLHSWEMYGKLEFCAKSCKQSNLATLYRSCQWL